MEILKYFLYPTITFICILGVSMVKEYVEISYLHKKK